MAYRYQTPRSQQYVSTFVPLPLDYLNQAMLSRQQAYDENYRMMMEAKDKYAAIETDPQNIALKNKILDDAFNQLDSVAKNKYNGDYSMIGNEAMLALSKLKTNPFWNYNAQHLTDWKQKKALRDQLQLAGKLGYADQDLDSGRALQDENGNWVLPKYNVYAKPNMDEYLDEFSGLMTQVKPVTVPDSDRPGYYKTIKRVGASPEEVNAAITADWARRKFEENPAFRYTNPEFSNPEVFRKSMVDRLNNKIGHKEDVSYEWNRYAEEQRDFNNSMTLEKLRDSKNPNNGLGLGRVGPMITPSHNFRFAPDGTDLSFKDVISNPANKKYFDGFIRNKAKELGLNIKSYNDFENQLNKATSISTNSPFLMGIAGLDQSAKRSNESEDPNQYKKDLPKLKQIKDALEQEYQDYTNQTIQGFSLNDLYSTNEDDQKFIDTNIKVLNKSFIKHKKDFSPIVEKDKDKFDKSAGFELTDIYTHNGETLYQVNLIQKDKEGKDIPTGESITIRANNPRSNTVEDNVLRFFTGIDDRDPMTRALRSTKNKKGETMDSYWGAAMRNRHQILMKDDILTRYKTREKAYRNESFDDFVKRIADGQDEIDFYKKLVTKEDLDNL